MLHSYHYGFNLKYIKWKKNNKITLDYNLKFNLNNFFFFNKFWILLYFSICYINDYNLFNTEPKKISFQYQIKEEDEENV